MILVIHFDSAVEYFAALDGDWTNDQDVLRALHELAANRYFDLAPRFNAVAQTHAVISYDTPATRIWYDLARAAYFIGAEHRRCVDNAMVRRFL